MDNDSSLLFAKTLIKFVKNICRAYVLIDGTVTAVNANFTVDILLQGVTYSNCPTKVLIGSQASIFEIPVVGTTCLVKFRDGNRQLPQIDSFDKVDKLLINCQSLVQFNGGNNGGMVLVNNLVTRMNLLENAFNTHIHDGVQTGGGVSLIPTIQITQTTANEIQNPKITQ